ncbi:MAG: hypothetical protein MI807_03385, partial [Verrucomicrobiales bacterium]|nr:hypothetical protein [Verrucomicrobiales bacterium]
LARRPHPENGKLTYWQHHAHSGQGGTCPSMLRMQMQRGGASSCLPADRIRRTENSRIGNITRKAGRAGTCPSMLRMQIQRGGASSCLPVKRVRRAANSRIGSITRKAGRVEPALPCFASG